jgi:hypothetical protein
VQTTTTISKNTQNWNQYPAGTVNVIAMETIKDFGVMRGLSRQS